MRGDAQVGLAKRNPTPPAAIFREAGRELALICDALRRALQFGVDEPVPVSYAGGAFNAGELLLAPFTEALRAASPQFEVRTPLHAPHYGAALYATRLARRLPTGSFP